MGKSGSREVRHNASEADAERSRPLRPSSGAVAERGCRKRMFCCFWKRDEADEPVHRRSDFFHSCDEMSMENFYAHRTVDDAVQDLQRSIRTLQRLSLPQGGAQACENLLQQAQELDAVISGSSAARRGSKAAYSKLAEPRGADCGAGPAPPLPHPGGLAPALNRLTSILWPRIDKYVEKLIYESIEPSINASLPGMLQGGVRFTKVSLGESSPTLGPLRVEHMDNGAIEVHMGVDLRSHLDVELTAMGLGIGITNMNLKGDLVILLTPPSMEPPFFAGLQMYFPNPPDASVEFAGAARLANVPGLRGAVRSALDSSIAGICVLPRRIAVDMNEQDDVDFIDMTYPEPIGILRLTLRSGSNLIAADRNLFGAATSDPYVVAALGIKTWSSPVIGKTLNPVWGGDEGITVDFPVHDACQKLNFKVFDHDFGKSDDLIGIATSIDVKDLTSAGSSGTTEIPLLKADGEPGAGSLTISACLLKLKDHRPSDQVTVGRPTGPSSAHLSFKALTLRGLELTAEFPFKIRLGVRSEKQQLEDKKIARSRTGIFSKKTQAPPQRSSTTGQLSSEQGNGSAMEVEVLTNASTPKPQKELAEALQNICKALSEKGNDAQDIADILDVSPKQVNNFLLSQQQNEDSKKALKEATDLQQARSAVRRPIFDEVLQLLVPSDCEEGYVELAILDKHAKALGTARIEMKSVFEAPGLCLEGPFVTDTNVQVIGTLRLHCLHY